MKETTIFREALGDSPVIKTLDFLIEGRGLDYSLSDIAKNANIGWTTLHRIWGNLLKLKILKIMSIQPKLSYIYLSSPSFSKTLTNTSL
jgi:hypothetical protein